VTSGARIPISIEAGVAEELDVGLGDEIVWDVQGVRLVSEIVGLREVEWARFEPNFFVVFPEGPLDDAPQSLVTLTRVEDPQQRGLLQRELMERFPNVSVLDLAHIQQALEDLIGRVALAIRFMALFSLATGVVVLFGAVAANRSQRVREAALLKTMGATRRQVQHIALAEYLFLGALSATVALMLAAAATWALMRFVFEAALRLPPVGALGLMLGVVALTLAVGIWNSFAVFRRTPLQILRTE
jgi:putative ABC transport system permease protein